MKHPAMPLAFWQVLAMIFGIPVVCTHGENVVLLLRSALYSVTPPGMSSFVELM